MEVRSGEGFSCEQQLNNSTLVPDSVEEIRVFQACTSGWRCDTKCRALAHTRKCAFFPLVSIPCFCDQRERNLTGDVLPSASRQCSVRLQQSAHVFAFSLLSSSTVPVCWSCADSSTHLRWLKTSSWWKKTRCREAPETFTGRNSIYVDVQRHFLWNKIQRNRMSGKRQTRISVREKI